MLRSASLLVLLLLVPVSSAYAQRDRLLVEPSPPAEWGLTFSLQPSWEMYPLGLSKLVASEKDDIEGADGRSTYGGSTWSIGFARGRVLGADWGVSFSHTRIRKDAVINRLDLSQCGPPNCSSGGQRLTFRDVTAIGPEAHLYVPFFTIKDRVQAGIVMAGGIAHIRGRAEVLGVEFDPDDPFAGSRVVQREGEIADIGAEEIVMGDQPWTVLGRFEPGVAVIISPRVKVHAGLGFHFPGTTYFSLKTTYFFPKAAP